ncbi:MAG: hypothetical protein K0S32_246 [Bacteroidetes bacterium]|jgi:hypothetical protein|nr:hypothetical protein [Bacteroidota bacterium]
MRFNNTMTAFTQCYLPIHPLRGCNNLGITRLLIFDPAGVVLQNFILLYMFDSYGVTRLSIFDPEH